jgi:hypothetical protein
VLELYGQFAKFSKSEIQHFCKLEQQRKVSKPDETPRPDTMTINEATPSMYTTLTLMAVGHQKARKRTLDHLRRKETQEFSTKDTPQYSQRGGAPNRGCGHGRDPYTVKPLYCLYHGNETANAQKIAPFSLKPSRKWSKNPLNLRNKHQGRSTTQCNGLPTANNTPHHILRFSHCNHTKIATPNPRPLTNPITTPPAIILNLRLFHK